MQGIALLFDQIGAIGKALVALSTLAVILGFKQWGWPRVVAVCKAIGRFFGGIGAIADLALYMPEIQGLASMEQRIRRIHMEVLPNGGGSLRDAVTATRDTTQRHETALNLFIASQRAQWDGLGLFGVAEYSAEGEMTYSSTTLQKWTNRTENELLGTGWINAIGMEFRELVRREWDSCVEDVREFSLAYNMRNAQGAEFGVTTTAMPIREQNNGPVVKWVAVIQRSQGGAAHA